MCGKGFSTTEEYVHAYGSELAALEKKKSETVLIKMIY